MWSIDVLTINAEPEDDQDLVKLAEHAKAYFPTETWDDIRYLGKLSLEYDVKILTGKESLEAFLFEKLTKRIRKVRDSHRSLNLLLAITPDPIVAMYYFFDGKNFKRTLYLVHDYVAETVGVVSLFQVNKRTSTRVIAHGLGHSRGLRHHLEPIDLMYPELLRASTLQVEGFCKACLDKLAKNPADT